MTCDTGVSSLAATTLRRFAHVWLRMRGCRKVGNAKETQPHASETHGGHGPVAVALCHGAHSACVLALSRATAGHLGPGGASHSEPIQSCQPVPLASVALLLRRARLDDAVGRLGLLPHWAPRPHHSRGCCSQLGRALQKQKTRQKRENEVAWLWRKKKAPALALAPKLTPRHQTLCYARRTAPTSQKPYGTANARPALVKPGWKVDAASKADSSPRGARALDGRDFRRSAPNRGLS